MGFTSNLAHAGSNGRHSLELTTKADCKYSMKLPNLPRDDYEPNKGDLWKIKMSTLAKGNCIKIGMIASLSIVSTSNDGWNIDSIVTFVEDTNKKFKLFTQDFEVNRWIDSNGQQSHKRFDLTRA